MNINNPTTFGTPSLTWSTSNSSGTGGALRADDSVAIFSATVPETIAYGQSAAAGDDAYASRLDHIHGMAASDAVAAATQAEQEAGSSTSVFTSPGRQQFHPSAAKAWCLVNASQILQTPDYNVGSVTDSGTGDATVVYTTNFSTAVYSAVATPELSSTWIRALSMATGSIRIITTNATPAQVDSIISLVCFGDQ